MAKERFSGTGTALLPVLAGLHKVECNAEHEPRCNLVLASSLLVCASTKANC